MLTDRANVTVEAVRAEIADSEASYRKRMRALRALLRVLETESETETAAAAEEGVDDEPVA